MGRADRLKEVYEYVRKRFPIHTQSDFAERLKYNRAYHSGINAMTGEPTAAAARKSTISVPASYIGTTGQLIASIFGICVNDYTTDVSVTASDASSQTIASVALDDVPMKRNTTTSYSGPLFTRQPTFTMIVADSWGEDITDIW